MFARPKTSITRRFALAAALAGSLALAACESLGVGTAPVVAAPEIGLYELRIYTATPGKIGALDARFRDHAVGLFRKHGMTPIGFFHTAWQPGGQTVDNRLFYILGYKDRAARDIAWTTFANDPEWKQAYADSQKDGSLTTKIENIFMTATDYSPKLDLRNTSSSNPRLFELRTYTTNAGKLEDLHSRFRDNTLRIFTKNGMTNMLYWRPTGGQPQMANKLVYLLAFPDIEARTQAFQKFSADPEWQKVSTDSNRNGPLLASPNGVVAVQLTPTDYSPLK